MRRERTFGISQFITIIVVAVALFLAWDFGRRILDTIQLVQAAQQAATDLQTAQRVNVQLKQLKNDVTTDEWVIKKSRIDLHYARDNETVFVPAATPVPPVPPPPAIPAPPPRPWWQDWLEAIFGPAQ